jgi:parvulin-like peptidyl-prolyl isomerase
VPPDTLGRAGPVHLDLAGLRVAIAESRVLQAWQGREAPVEALASVELRQRLLSQALENRVVRLEVNRRGLSVDASTLERALVNAAAGQPADAPLSEPPPSAAVLDERLRARYGVAPEVVARVARDMLESARLSEALLDEVSDLKAAWMAANTEAVLDLVLSPRVPTSQEIDRAVRARAAEIAAWYAKNEGRFNQPERLRLSRIAVKVAAETEAEAVRITAESLRNRVLAGEDFRQLARTESDDPSARRGGGMALVPAEKRPDLAKLAPNALSPVTREGEYWSFYRLDAVLPAVVRSLDSGPVQREIAATLLRAADDLPEAVGLAQQAAAMLMREPEGNSLPALVRVNRLKRFTTRPFVQSGHDVVPGLGLAPEVFAGAFTTPVGKVAPRVTVRQDYVVYRVVSRTSPDPTTWPEARAAFVAQWRSREIRQAEDRWLSQRLKGEVLWVATERLAAIPLAELLAAPVP